MNYKDLWTATCGLCSLRDLTLKNFGLTFKYFPTLNLDDLAPIVDFR